MNKDTITTLVLLIEKYRKRMQETCLYIEFVVLRTVVEDLEELKDALKKEIDDSKNN